MKAPSFFSPCALKKQGVGFPKLFQAPRLPDTVASPTVTRLMIRE
jgi:hypothetical protein